MSKSEVQKAELEASRSAARRIHIAPIERLERRVAWLEEVVAVVAAAKGLAHGSDWNKGTYAILHGYRQKLVDLLAAEPKE